MENSFISCIGMEFSLENILILIKKIQYFIIKITSVEATATIRPMDAKPN